MCTGFNLQAATCTGFVLATKHVYRLQSSSCHLYWLRSRHKTCVPTLIFKLPPIPASFVQEKCVLASIFQLTHVPASFSQQNMCTGFSLPAATRIGFVLATKHVYRLQSARCHPYRFRYCKEKRGPASIFKLLPVPASFSQQNMCTGFNLQAATCTGFVIARKSVDRLQSSSCYPYRLRSRNKTCVPASVFQLPPVLASFSQQNTCTGFNLQDATRTGFVIARKSVDRLQFSSCYPYRLRSRNKTCVPASIFKLPPVPASFVQGKVCIGFNLSAATCTGFVLATKRVFRLQPSSCHLYRLGLRKGKACTGFNIKAAT